MKRVLCIGMAIGLCILSVACSASADEESTSTTTTTVTTTTTTTTTTKKTTTTTAKVYDTNPLTGEKNMDTDGSKRPIGVMVANDSRARPQYGIDKADMYIESETEGGITRLMAIFASPSRVPSKLAPVRSARTHFVLLAESLDMIYAHAGGSTEAKKALAARDLADVDALVWDGSYFWRDSGLRADKGYEYSMMTSGSKMESLAKRMNFRTSSRASRPFTFDTAAASGDTATRVQCKVTASQTVSFRYNANTGLYDKYNGTLSSGTAHTSASGERIAVSNVVVMFARKYKENNTTISFTLTEGDGVVFTAGRTRPIRWSRTASALSFTETNGNKAALSIGKTYILLVNEDYQNSTFGRE